MKRLAERGFVQPDIKDLQSISSKPECVSSTNALWVTDAKAGGVPLDQNAGLLYAPSCKMKKENIQTAFGKVRMSSSQQQPQS
jgi:hypothetical protein